MTTVAGFQVFRTSCCSAVYKTLRYGSINFSAGEIWTDGRAVNGLYPQDWGLRQCACNSYYLINQCEKLHVIEQAKPVAPTYWAKGSDSWWWKNVLGRHTREYYEKYYDTRSLELIEAESKATPPNAIHVDDQYLDKVIANGEGNLELLVIARRRLWRFLNDPYRDLYREHKKVSPATFPEYIPSYEVLSNVQALIDLLTLVDEPNNLELAELYRQLGKFELARKFLDSIDLNDNDQARVIAVLLDQKRIGPAWYSTW